MTLHRLPYCLFSNSMALGSWFHSCSPGMDQQQLAAIRATHPERLLGDHVGPGACSAFRVAPLPAPHQGHLLTHSQVVQTQGRSNVFLAQVVVLEPLLGRQARYNWPLVIRGLRLLQQLPGRDDAPAWLTLELPAYQGPQLAAAKRRLLQTLSAADYAALLGLLLEAAADEAGVAAAPAILAHDFAALDPALDVVQGLLAETPAAARRRLSWDLDAFDHHATGPRLCVLRRRQAERLSPGLLRRAAWLGPQGLEHDHRRRPPRIAPRYRRVVASSPEPLAQRAPQAHAVLERSPLWPALYEAVAELVTAAAGQDPEQTVRCLWQVVHLTPRAETAPQVLELVGSVVHQTPHHVWSRVEQQELLQTLGLWLRGPHAPAAEQRASAVLDDLGRRAPARALAALGVMHSDDAARMLHGQRARGSGLHSSELDGAPVKQLVQGVHALVHGKPWRQAPALDAALGALVAHAVTRDPLAATTEAGSLAELALALELDLVQLALAHGALALAAALVRCIRPRSAQVQRWLRQVDPDPDSAACERLIAACMEQLGPLPPGGLQDLLAALDLQHVDLLAAAYAGRELCADQPLSCLAGAPPEVAPRALVLLMEWRPQRLSSLSQGQGRKQLGALLQRDGSRLAAVMAAIWPRCGPAGRRLRSVLSWLGAVQQRDPDAGHGVALSDPERRWLGRFFRAAVAQPPAVWLPALRAPLLRWLLHSTPGAADLPLLHAWLRATTGQPGGDLDDLAAVLVAAAALRRGRPWREVVPRGQLTMAWSVFSPRRAQAAALRLARQQPDYPLRWLEGSTG